MMFGEILLREQLITAEQLERALAVQKEKVHKTIGAIVSELYDISVEVVETVFIDKVLIPSVKEWFIGALTRRWRSEGFDIGAFITNIEIMITDFTRHIIDSTCFVKKGEVYQPVFSKVALERVTSIMDKLIINTANGKRVEFENVFFEYQVADHQILLDNPAILSEARIRLLHAYKEDR